MNNLFFLGSLLVTFTVARRFAGSGAGTIAAIIAAAFFASDILVSYSGLSEPILISFILLGSYQFARLVRAGEPDRATGTFLLGFVALLASATHYIGWFFASFVSVVAGIFMVQAAAAGRYRESATYLSAILLCLLFPGAWMLNNYRIWGDPLHFARIARDIQAPYAGSLPVLQRILIPRGVLFETMPAIAVSGIVALALAGRRDWRLLAYVMPAGAIFAMIWASTAAGLAAPYQEPRYVIFLGWVMIPYIAAWQVDWWQTAWRWKRIGPAVLVILIGVTGLAQTFSFSNSFGPDVREAADVAGRWLQERGEEARVLVQGDSFAERGVIPVTAGYPNRFVFVEAANLHASVDDPRAFLDTFGEEWLAIVKDGEFARAAHRGGLTVRRVGVYHIVFGR